MTTEVAAETAAPTESSAPTTESTDAAALAAAREALGKAGEEAPAEAAPEAPEAEGTEAPAAPTPSAPDAMTELEKLRQEIRAKEQEQKQREKLEGEYKKRLDESLAAERARLQKEVRDQLLAEYRESFKLRPAEAITELGLDGASLVTDLAERAGPAGRAMAEIAALKAKLAEIETKGSKAADERIAKLEEERRLERERYQQEQVAAANRGLLTIVAEKAAPAIAYFGGEDTVVKRAQEIANEYCAAKGVDTCPYPIIVQQLESEARKGAAERLKSLDAQRSELTKLLQQPAGGTGQPTESNGRAKGPRTLSAAGASERRASPKPPAEMTEAERDEAARAAAREALGPPKKSRMA